MMVGWVGWSSFRFIGDLFTGVADVSDETVLLVGVIFDGTGKTIRLEE